jgi:hypothetical protein
MTTNTILIRRLTAATGLAGAAALLTLTPAAAQPAPDPSSGDVRVVTIAQPTPVEELRLEQVGLGVLAGAALAGVGVVVARSTRRTHVRPA